MHKTGKKHANDFRVLREVLLQPWFLPRQLGFKIHAMLPHNYRYKMRFYFDDYGCLKCERRNAKYGFNGFCTVCCEKIMHRTCSALKRRQISPAVKKQYTARNLQRAADAQQLLRDLR